MTKISNQYSLTNILTADLANSRLGINNVNPTVALDVTGAGRFSGSVTSDDLILTAGTLFSAGNTGFSNRLSDTTLYLQMPASGFNITDNALNTRFILSSAGAATFSSTIQCNGGLIQANQTEIFASAGASNRAYAFTVGNVAAGDFTISQGSTATGGTYTTRLIINPSGNFGINTTSPQSGLGSGITIEGASYAPLYVSNSGTQRGYFVGYSGGLIINASTGTLALNNGGANVLINTTTDNGERLYVVGAIRATGSITANSDISLKKNLLKIENALEKVEQINGYTYELKEDDSKRHAGVIAQEIQIVLPEIVNTGNDGLMGVEYGNISALLIEAIKELKAEIETLKNK